MTQATHVDVGKVGCSPDITVTDLEPVGGDHRECSPDIRRRKVHFPTPHLSARAGVAQTWPAQDCFRHLKYPQWNDKFLDRVSDVILMLTETHGRKRLAARAPAAPAGP